MNNLARCDNCAHVCPVEELAPAAGLAERMDPGGEIPAGECPKCGALSYNIKEPSKQRRVAALKDLGWEIAAEEYANGALTEADLLERIHDDPITVSVVRSWM